MGGHGTGYRGERNGGAETSRCVLRANHRVRCDAGVRVGRIVHVRLRLAVHPVGSGDRRAGRHIT